MRNHSFFSSTSFFHSLHSFILFILAFLLLTSCKPSSKEETKSTEKQVTIPYMIDIGNSIGNIKELPLSLIAKKMEYVPLETRGNSLLKKIDQLVFTDSFIFVSDFNKLLQFDRKGKFLRQIGKIGKGPGEYVFVMGFCVDQYRKKNIHPG